jgi:hypothetical protein
MVCLFINLLMAKLLEMVSIGCKFVLKHVHFVKSIDGFYVIVLSYQLTVLFDAFWSLKNMSKSCICLHSNSSRTYLSIHFLHTGAVGSN